MKKNMMFKLAVGVLVLTSVGFDSSCARTVKPGRLERVVNKLVPPPLHLAAKMGNTIQVNRLLRQGIDPDSRDDIGNTALHYAWRDKVALALLTGGATIEAKNHGGATPLHVTSTRAARFSIAWFLVKNGANVNATDASGATPMHAAAMFHNFPQVELYATNGADVNARNMRGFTPLHAAVGMGKLSKDEMRILVAGGIVEAGLGAALGAAIVSAAVPAVLIGASTATAASAAVIVAGGGIAVAGGGIAIAVPVAAASVLVPAILVGAAATTGLVIGTGLTLQAIFRHKTVDTLLDRGANINAVTNLGNTALHTMAAGRPFSIKAKKGIEY